MEKKLTDMTHGERREDIIQRAEYFTVVRKVGLSYERHEKPTLLEARAWAQQLANRVHRSYMIYAVAGISDTWVENVHPEASHEPR